MCLKIISTKKRNCHKVYKIVARGFGYNLWSIYQNYQFVHPRRWQYKSREVYLNGTEKRQKNINEGYHLCSNLKSAKKTLNNLPGYPDCRDGYEIWECEVRLEDFVASGTFALEKRTVYIKKLNAESVVYTTFRFRKKVKI